MKNLKLAAQLGRFPSFVEDKNVVQIIKVLIDNIAKKGTELFSIGQSKIYRRYRRTIVSS